MTKDQARRRRPGSLTLLLATTTLWALVAAAGCASGSTSSSTTVASATSTTAPSNPNDVASELNALAATIKGGETAVYKAVYSSSGQGVTGQVTIEQKPPKSLFKSGSGEAIDTGSAAYYCTTTPPATCISEGTGSADPLSALVQAFSPSAIATALQEAASQLAAHVQGYNAQFSTGTFAGVAADCVIVTSSGQTGKYCVTKGGVLAYAGSITESLQLTSYSTSVADGDFDLPAGATIKPNS
ncbi:MAG TPA: hypothetical protein VHT30_05635 [Acidimicrobiales bacterium]|jgi:hypothetical protein|nr:hypothetical protein [Acidimicrobiales bacterium]